MSVEGARYLYIEEPWNVSNLGVQIELPCTSKPSDPKPSTKEAKRPSIECEIDQFIKDCPSKDNLMKPQARKPSDYTNHGSTLLSSPRSPPQRKILPQTTTDLIRSKVIESRDNNAQQDCAKRVDH